PLPKKKKMGKPIESEFAAAHTNFDSNNQAHVAAEKAIHGKYPKPPHASQSARAVSRILVQALEQNEMLVRATITAISRHHAPFAEECKAFALEPQAANHMQATLA